MCRYAMFDVSQFALRSLEGKVLLSKALRMYRPDARLELFKKKDADGEGRS